MHGYLSLDIICSSKLTVFLELRSRKTVRFSEQIMSADKYPCIFSRQMETIVWFSVHFALYCKYILRQNANHWCLYREQNRLRPQPWFNISATQLVSSPQTLLAHQPRLWKHRLQLHTAAELFQPAEPRRRQARILPVHPRDPIELFISATRVSVFIVFYTLCWWTWFCHAPMPLCMPRGQTWLRALAQEVWVHVAL